MSRYRIRRTASANNDLLEAWFYVAEERKRDELQKDFRSWPTSTPYIVFYFLQDRHIIIAHVLRHARDGLSVEDWPDR